MKSIVFVVAVLIACANAALFTNKTVLVTGGSSGIGYQTALQFAQEGARVIIAARNSHKQYYTGEEAAEKINNDTMVKKAKGEARFVKTDLTSIKEVEALFKDIRDNEKKLDFAVNAAGISGPIGKLDETSQWSGGAYDPILNNYYATMIAMSEEEALMVETNTSGSIVNVGSLYSVTPLSSRPRYSAASYAIVGLAKSVALEHITVDAEPYIRVNTVLPGPIATPLLYNQAKFSVDSKTQPWEGDYIVDRHDKTWQKYEPDFYAHVPMSRIGEPNEVANTILFLCTDDAIHVSADTILIDGGSWAI